MAENMIELQDVIRNRAWLRPQSPFPYVTATNVFVDGFYRKLETELAEILHGGTSEVPGRQRFSRNISNYDAHTIGFTPLTKGALSLFASPPWHDLLASLFDVAGTDHVNVGAHHHQIGSKNGWVHNDFNPVWFPSVRSGRIGFPDHDRCDYKSGAGPLGTAEKVQVVRAVAMIFYLLNHGWVEGDGGETGLFASARTGIDASTVRIRPIDNSILAFECTPHSYHAFLHNPGRPRNCIIMWIHRSMHDAMTRWCAADLQGWVS